MNLESGKWIRYLEGRWSGGDFARGGNALLMFGPIRSGVGELQVTALEPEFLRFKHTVPFRPGDVAVVSDDLRRVAVVSDGVLAIHDLESAALLGSIRIAFPKGSNPRLFFVDRDTVRLYVQEASHRQREQPASLRIYEYSVPTRKLEQTGELTTTARWLDFRLSADGSTLLVRRIGVTDDAVLLADGRTGQTKAGMPGPALSGSVVLLGDGKVVSLDFKGRRGTLRVFDRDGTYLRDIEIGEGTYGRVTDLGRDDTIAVHVWSFTSKQHVAVVDNATGTVMRREPGVFFDRVDTGADPRNSEPSRSGELVLRDLHEAAWRWNAFTGEKKRLITN
jgi:hypothetical protein